MLSAVAATESVAAPSRAISEEDAVALALSVLEDPRAWAAAELGGIDSRARRRAQLQVLALLEDALATV
jgi:hypothetical protein